MTQVSVVVGSVVQLKSGGEKMTVVTVGPNRYIPRRDKALSIHEGHAHVAWFEGGVQREETFPLDALNVVD